MTDRLAGIRARLDDAPITIHGPEPLVRWLEQKDSDIAWLMGRYEAQKAMADEYRFELDRLRERIAKGHIEAGRS